MALRDLPPVEPLEVPQRLSQSLLRHMSVCPRSAYLYLKYQGGPPSHAMDRGSAFHFFAERAIRLLVERDETQLPPEVAKDLMLDTIAQHPELTTPPNDHEALKIMAYHFATGFQLNPADVVAVEQTFVMDIGDWKVSGKVDLASISGDHADIIDWKTTLALPDQETFDGSFQLPTYALLMAEGRPVSRETCWPCKGTGLFADGGPEMLGCPDCNGLGYIDTLGEPLGQGLQTFELSEYYPRYLWDEGIARRTRTIDRLALRDYRIYLEGVAAKWAKATEEWKFEAVPGSHCAVCAAPQECPLPTHLRDYAGGIDSWDKAKETAELWFLAKKKLAATQKELRNWANLNGDIPIGVDVLLGFDKQERTTTDWEGLEQAVTRHFQTGEPYNLADYRKSSVSTVFKDRKIR